MPTRTGPGSSFFDVLTAAVEDLAETGYDSQERVDRWMRELREAAVRSMIDPASLEQMLRDGLATTYRKMVDLGGVLRFNPGVERFTLERVRPAMRAELDRRISASANLIKLNRQQAIDKTLQRFQGWSTSIPKGGISGETKSEVKAVVRKSLKQLPYEERRVLIDQGHKLTAAISEIMASDGGAIAGTWRSNFRQAGYDYREDHKERDGRVYLIRDSWAHRAGLVKKGKAGYYDDVTAVGQEPFCRCYMIWIYNLRELPEEMITLRGKEGLQSARGFEEVRAARNARADSAIADGHGTTVANRGISHLGSRGVGTQAACGNARAHMTYAKEVFRTIPADQQCKRCAEKLTKWDEIRARTSRADDDVLMPPRPKVGHEANLLRLERLRDRVM